MGNARTRLLAIATFVVAGLFLLDRAAQAFFFGPWERAGQDLMKAEQELSVKRAVVAREQKIRDGWRKIRGLLDKPRTPDVHTHFVTCLGDISDRVGVTFEFNGSAPQQTGDFKEYVYEIRFKLAWGQFVDLLAELHASKEFIKPLRVTVTSQYEKEDRLDLDLKLSTIEYAPAPVKGASK